MRDELSNFDFSVVRDFRRRAGMTIAELSAQTGVSTAVISKLERNQTVAELGTLLRLARAFGMNVTDLLALAESRTAHASHERSHRSGGFHFQEVRYANCRLLMGHGQAGGKVSQPKVHQDDFEICWVLKGRIRITLPSEQHVMESGDCLQFDAILPHTYEILEDCRIAVAHLRKSNRF